MTTSRDAAPAEFEDLEGAIAVLRNAGHRASAARRLTLQALFAADGPVSADRIAQGLGGDLTAADLATTYRNLETLEGLGIVRHFHLGHGPGLYALAAGRDREYLVCERCGRVSAVDPAELNPIRDQVRKKFGYEARFTHFPIVGLCASCAKREGSKRNASTRAKGDQTGDHEHLHSHGGYAHSHPHGHGEGPGQGHKHEHR